jgi:hypothetical protein
VEGRQLEECRREPRSGEVKRHARLFCGAVIGAVSSSDETTDAAAAATRRR